MAQCPDNSHTHVPVISVVLLFHQTTYRESLILMDIMAWTVRMCVYLQHFNDSGSSIIIREQHKVTIVLYLASQCMYSLHSNCTQGERISHSIKSNEANCPFSPRLLLSMWEILLMNFFSFHQTIESGRRLMKFHSVL